MTTAMIINATNTTLTEIRVVAIEGGSTKLGVTPGGGFSAGTSDKGTPGGMGMFAGGWGIVWVSNERGR